MSRGPYSVAISAMKQELSKLRAEGLRLDEDLQKIMSASRKLEELRSEYQVFLDTETTGRKLIKMLESFEKRKKKIEEIQSQDSQQIIARQITVESEVEQLKHEILFLEAKAMVK